MLTKYSFPLTHLFLCYQTPKNMENYLYTRFFIKKNGALGILRFSILGEFIKILGFQSLKIQISCLDNLQRVEDLDLINSPRILNLKIPEFEITSKPIEF